MKRVHWHWTGGGYKATSLDKKHYHRIFEGDGKAVNGNLPISANAAPITGDYAAHTWKANTDAIGLSMACMLNATERDFGKCPMTEAQFEAMMKETAVLCKQYGIPVTDKTTLSHAEVQPNLGITQKGKWDFTVLPFKPELKGAKACGDYARERVRYYLSQLGDVPAAPKPASKPAASTKDDVRGYQSALLEKGYKLGEADGVHGPKTTAAIKMFQVDVGLPATGKMDDATKKALYK